MYQCTSILLGRLWSCPFPSPYLDNEGKWRVSCLPTSSVVIWLDYSHLALSPLQNTQINNQYFRAFLVSKFQWNFQKIWTVQLVEISVYDFYFFISVKLCPLACSYFELCVFLNFKFRFPKDNFKLKSKTCLPSN